MKKFKTAFVTMGVMLALAGCTSEGGSSETVSEESQAGVSFEAIGENETATETAQEPVTEAVEPVTEAVEPVTEAAETSEENSTETKAETSGDITEEMALSAIENYCYTTNPDLKSGVDDGTYTVYWDIESSDDKEIVVLYRSYTAAEVRYYIDRATGDTYVTEFVSGITPEEERTDENFNIKEYIPAE